MTRKRLKTRLGHDFLRIGRPEILFAPRVLDVEDRQVCRPELILVTTQYYYLKLLLERIPERDRLLESIKLILGVS